jgi:superfamily II DNA or RNA helicase
MKTNRDQIQKEALEKVLPLNRSGIAVTMGGGKTLIGLHHANANYNEFARFLIVAPKKSIFKEWQSQAKQFGLEHLLPHFTFTTYLSLSKQELDYDVVYFDECHSLLESQEVWLSQYTGKILGLTGTPPRFKKSEKGKMVDKYCPIVYEYKTDDAVTAHILNDYQIVIHNLSLNYLKNIKVEKNGKIWFTSERATYDYWSNRVEGASSKKEEQIMRVMRMKSLMTFASKEILAKKLLVEIKDKVILFANTQTQADSFGIPSYHSNNQQSEFNLELFKEGKILRLAAVLQLSEGVNIPNLKQGIILHAYGNERKTSQRLGRLLRLSPKETSIIHILCYENTVDETWVTQSLSGFDQSKITIVNTNIL